MPDDAPLPEQPFAPAGEVAVKLPGGSVKTIPQQYLGRAMTEDGAVPATEPEYFGAVTGKPGEAYSALAGAARTMSFGTSDALMVHGAEALGGQQTGEDIRHLLNLAREANPNATLGGEVAGAVAPAFFGGVGAGARAAESLLGRVAIGAGEGAGIGAAGALGHQYSEDTLGNHKLVAENYLTAGLKGGALGALVGGVGGAIAGKGAAKEEGAYFGAPAEKTVAREEAQGASSWLERQADKEAFRATGASGGDIRRLARDVDKQSEEVSRLGSVLRKEGIVGERIEGIGSIAQRVDEKAAKAGKKINGFYKAFDKTDFRPSMENITQRFEAEVKGPAAATLMGERDVKPAEMWLGKLQEKGGAAPGFEQLWKFRREIDQELKSVYSAPQGMPVPPGKEPLLKLKNLVSEEIERAGEQAANTIGDGVMRDFRATNSLYSDLKAVQRITSKKAASADVGPFFNFTDLARAAIGGSFHPMGLGMGVASAMGRRYGAQTAAYVLGKASGIEELVSASRSMEDALSSGTRGFLSGAKGSIRPQKLVSAEEIRAVRDATRNPEAVESRVSTALGDLPRYAPKVAQQAATTAVRAAAWMQHTLPKEPPPVGLGFTQQPRPISDSERLRATQTLEIIGDPTLVIDRLREGRLTPTHVATLEAVYPETYAQIQNYIREHGAELRPKLNVQQEVALSLLFKQPLNASMIPANVRALQASFTTGNQAPKPRPENPTGGEGGGERATAYDKMEGST